MSTPTETNKAIETGAESPTTARPLELDDDDGQDSGTGAERTASPMRGNKDAAEVAPPKPPRPLTEAQKNENMLKEAFPSIELNIIKAVLTASGGNVEPAFNALLQMTDPEAVKNEPEETPPPQPPRPQNNMAQVEADEIYARQLAEQYDNVGAYEARTSNRSGSGRPRGQPRPQQPEERERTFMDDDFPIIRDNLRQGFFETQTKVNGWINTLKKKIEDNFDESSDSNRPDPPINRRQGEPSRRSNDYDRYDADPQVLTDDFAGMKFSSDGTPAFNSRPMANTGIYRPPPSTSPRPSGEKRVGFKDEPEEINMYDTSPKLPTRDASLSSSSKVSKWQPLSTVQPDPISDNDPFSLGDSEDEKDIKEKPKDSKAEEAERLKKATSEAMADTLVDSKNEAASSGKN